MRASNPNSKKEPLLFRSTQTHSSIIDLTKDSDNDDDGGTFINFKPGPLKREATVTSNHGMILPGSPLLSNIKSEGSNTAVEREVRPSTPRLALALTNSYAGIRNGNVVRPGGVGGLIGGMASHDDLERASSFPSNPAKRRKINGGTSAAPQSIQSVTVFKHGVPIEEAPAARVSSADKYQNDPRMQRVMNDHVLKHITTAISRYRRTIPKQDADRIAKQAAIKIVTREDFVPNFEAHNFDLSRNYKKEIAEMAERYILESAREVLASSKTPLLAQSNNYSLPAVSAGANPKAHKVSIPSRPSPVKKPTSSVRALSPSSRSSSESKSTSIESDLERQRRYSSSPTTSFTDIPEDTDDELKTRQAQAQYKSPILSIATQILPSRKQPQSGLRQRSAKAIGKSTTHSYSAPPPMISSATSNQLRLVSLGIGEKRPYLRFADRQYIKRGLGATSVGRRQELIDHIFHVDFCQKELNLVGAIIRSMVYDTQQKESTILPGQITMLISDHKLQLPRICQEIEAVARMPGKNPAQHVLRGRDKDSIYAFLQDALAGRLPLQPQVFQIGTGRKRCPPAVPPISTLLREREIWGSAPQRVRQGLQSFQVEFCNHLEDTLTRKSEWTDCCGDISAFSWTSDDAFICGATAHSDFHNMQYNKPGNLGVGSCTLDTLRSICNHRILRPVVGSPENIENSLEAMRQTQDRWLYTSVVSTSHSEYSGFAFTASFDHTVKVWKVSDQGASIDLAGTWEHDGKVNFVVTSKWHGKVATASDVCNKAIRLYDIDQADVGRSPYRTYSGDRAQEQAMELERKDTWAYYPATISWGSAPSVRNILLVGYSPRSVSGHEMDIPEEKRNSGELCLWDTDGERIRISSAHLQNVFEVIWHQTQPIFIAATSPCGMHEPAVTKTQVRLFAQNEFGVFLQVKTLDCGASDINELTVMPNGTLQCYVTASCTDGNTYVWDTAQGDRPIHTLGHGESLDNPLHDVPREIADTGVKFASWGQASSRFYTGSSDGKVKAWDIRAPKGQAFVRTVMSVTGGISSGLFSRDFSKLLIGDATGKVHLLEIDRDDLDDDTPQERAPQRTVEKTAPWIPKSFGRKAPPRVIAPHREPTPPLDEIEGPTGQTAEEMARAFLEEGQLRICPNRKVGAVQGPNYAETMLYRLDAHEDNDSTKPLLPHIQVRQQYEVIRRWDNTLHVPSLPQVSSSSQYRHAKNMKLDLEFSIADQQRLKSDGVDLDFEPNSDFEFESSIRTKKFKIKI